MSRFDSSKQAPMKPVIYRPALGLTLLLLVILITYRQTASGSDTPKNSGKMLTVTAASRITEQQNSPVLVKGILRKGTGNQVINLLDEDSLSSQPRPILCQFGAADEASIRSLPDDTELVIEGIPASTQQQAALKQCTIVSINNGTVYAEPFPEH